MVLYDYTYFQSLVTRVGPLTTFSFCIEIHDKLEDTWMSTNRLPKIQLSNSVNLCEATVTYLRQWKFPGLGLDSARTHG